MGIGGMATRSSAQMPTACCNNNTIISRNSGCYFFLLLAVRIQILILMDNLEYTKQGFKGYECLPKSNISLDIEVPFFMHKTFFNVRNHCNVGAYTLFRGGRITSLKKIGRFCSVAPDVTIGDGEHPTSFLSTHHFQYGGNLFDFWKHFKDHKGNQKLSDEDVTREPPSIGNDVWIGAGVYIKRGVKIGDGAIIAAGAVVTKDINPYEIVGGVPAKPIRKRFSDIIIRDLLEIQWWNYPIKSLRNFDFRNVEKCIIAIREGVDKGIMRPAEYDIIKIRH